MNEKMSLRSRGMLALIRDIIGEKTFTIDRICREVSETPVYVKHVLDEMEDATYISKKLVGDSTYEYTLNVPLEGSEFVQETIKTRIHRLFRSDKIYDLIAWFFNKVHVDYKSDKYLKKAVQREYEAARVVQFWLDIDDIETAFVIAEERNPDVALTLQHVLDYLNEKAHG